MTELTDTPSELGFEEKLLAVLERIACALEIANMKPAPASYGSYNMVQCPQCYTWYTPGYTHTCNNWRGHSGG